MGSFLGKTDPSPPSSAQVRTDLPTGRTNRRASPPLYQMHRVQHVHCVHSRPQHRPARRLPRWDPAHPPARRVNEAWRRFPMRRTQNSIMRPLPSDWWESYCKRTIWSLRHPRPVCSPVTVKISPPERRAAASLSPANVINSAGPLASEQLPDPCAKETVLRALRECGKGKKREQPPFPEALRRRSAPGARPSAFKPLVKTGAPPRFVPRRGPLKRSRNSWGSDPDLNRRPSWSSWSSGTSTHTGPPSSKRNPISSSYSSSRYFSEPWRRSILRASLQSPEWPIKKQESGGQPHSPVPPDTGSESSEACVPSGSPLLLPTPADWLPVSPAPWSGDGVTEEDLALGRKAGLPGSNRTRKDTTEAPADKVPGGRPAVPQPSSVVAAAQGPNLLLESVQAMRKSPRPRGSPRATGEAISAAPSPPAPAGCSQPQPLPGPCSQSRSRAAFISPAPTGTTSPVTGTVPQADRADVSPVALPTQSAQSALKGSPTPHPPEPAPSAHTVLKPRLEPQIDMGKGDSIYPSTSAPAEVFPSPFLCTAPGTTTPTFKPIFRGAVAPLTTLPVPALLPTKQPSAPFPPASTHLFHSLVKATSVVMSTSLTSTTADSTLKPALSLGVVSMASAVGNTCSVPSTWHTFLLGATQALRAGFLPGTGLFLPPPQRPTIPPVHTVTIFSQVLPSAVQIASSGSSSNAIFSVSGSPPSASALVPTLSPSSSSLTPVSMSPMGSSPRPPFPPSPGATHLPATNGQKKQGHSQPVVPTSFSSSSLSGNSQVTSPTPVPAPAWPNLGDTTQPGFGDQTSSASTFYPAASFKPDLSSGFPFSQTSTPSFGAVTQKRWSGACGPVFGSKAPRPFAFGGVVTPMDCGEPEGLSPTVPDASSTHGAFGTGAVPPRAAGPGTPFGESWRQNAQGLSGQSTPFALGRSSLSARSTTFGMASMSPFAQSTSIFGQAKAGSGFGFGLLSPTAQDTVGRGPFRSALPSFSIGVKPKTPKKWEQGHSRRHRAHRK
ncbi:POM121-like protein 2 [Lepus europaeus]|uniref:POM121-like protein 2 n=1 Tax=Lepus europaeus TaxID=9983 RepID=UPI002B49622A|nr:POM121-like protein 2 [Lepus europaeus]